MPSYKPLYGYRWDDPGHKQKNKYVLYEPEAEVVRRIYIWKIKGVTIQRICIMLNDEGIPTPNGGRIWRPQVVLDILRHPSYMGKAYALRHKWEMIPGKGMKHVLRPQEEWIELPDGTIPAIVSESEWQQVQRQLQWNKEQAARRNKHPEAALCRAGIAKCGICGANMAYKRRYDAATHGGADMYRCMKQGQLGNTCDNSVISVRIIDEAVWQKCLELLAHPRLIEIQNLTESLEDETNKEVRKVLSLRIADLTAEKSKAEEERDKVKRFSLQWEEAQEALEEFKKWCATIHRRIADGYEPTYQEKREAVDRLGMHVQIFRVEDHPRYKITCNPPEIASRLGPLHPYGHTHAYQHREDIEPGI